MNSGNQNIGSVKITNEIPQDNCLSILEEARNRLEILKLEQDNRLLYMLKYWGAFLLMSFSFVIATGLVCYVGYFLYLTTQPNMPDNAKEIKTIIATASGWFVMILNKITDVVKKPNNKF
jgi:hypothetical protein